MGEGGVLLQKGKWRWPTVVQRMQTRGKHGPLDTNWIYMESRTYLVPAVLELRGLYLDQVNGLFSF